MKAVKKNANPNSINLFNSGPSLGLCRKYEYVHTPVTMATVPWYFHIRQEPKAIDWSDPFEQCWSAEVTKLAQSYTVQVKPQHPYQLCLYLVNVIECLQEEVLSLRDMTKFKQFWFHVLPAHSQGRRWSRSCPERLCPHQNTERSTQWSMKVFTNWESRFRHQWEYSSYVLFD